MALVVRGKKKTFSCVVWHEGKAVWRSLRTSSLSLARARQAALRAKLGQKKFEVLDMIRSRRTEESLDFFLKIYAARAGEGVRGRTVRDNISCFRRVVGLATGATCGQVFPSQLTAETVRAYYRARVAAAGRNPLLRARAEVSADSELRQARSIFAGRVLHFYEGSLLPDLSGFMKTRLGHGQAQGGGFVPIPPEKLAVMEGEALGHSAEVGTLYLLMARLGLRNSEACAATDAWLVDSQGAKWLQVQRTATFEPKTKGAMRAVPVSEELWARLAALGQGYFLKTNAGGVQRELNRIIKKHLPGRTKGAYELRKQAGSTVATRDGILAAAKFLGDSVATAEKYYVALLAPLRAI